MMKIKKAEFIRIMKENESLLIPAIAYCGELSEAELLAYKEIAYTEPNLQRRYLCDNGKEIIFVDRKGEKTTTILSDSKFEKRTVFYLGYGFYCIHVEAPDGWYKNVYYAIKTKADKDFERDKARVVELLKAEREE